MIPELLSAGAGILGNVLSGINAGDAIKKAAQAQQAATSQAEQTIQGGQAQTAGTFAPYLNSGAAALAQLDALLGLGTSPASVLPASATTAPDYAAYVQNNPDLLALYQAQKGMAKGKTMAQFGQEHWQGYGQGESSRTYTPYGPAQSVASPQAPQSPQDIAAAQQAAIDQLKNSPLYQSLYRNGEQATLANAAATGGLRGGNTERSLYNLGSDTLAQVIQQQVANLGGLAGAGQNAAGTLGGFNANATNNIAGLITQGGAQQAGGILGGANAGNSLIKSLAGGLSSLAGNSQLMSALGLGGGISPGSVQTSPWASALSPDISVAAGGASPLNLSAAFAAPVF